MRKTATSILFIVLLYACTATKSTPSFADPSRYITDTVHTDEEDEALLEFISYSTYFHIISDTDRVDKQNRPGVLLSAKNTSYLNWNGEAAFGSPGDTCWISYRSNNEQVSVGRSAAISVFNFFNEERLNNNPEEYFTSKELNGSIKLGQRIVPFHFHQKKTEEWKSTGWVELNRDSLFLQPFLKAGNHKSSKNVKGLQLMRTGDDQPIAGIDLYSKPRNVFLRKDLSKENQAMISAYLFVLLCYL
jgi:hypothetical protein